MKSKYLFPHKFKKIGLILFIPSAVLGLYALIKGYEPEFLNIRVPAINFVDFFDERPFFTMLENNILNEITGVMVIIGLLLIAFSKEKIEDEYISKIRLESLVWAVYINYFILLLSFLFVYDLSFLWVMIFNMFTILIFFIIRFYWELNKLKKSDTYEEQHQNI